MKQLSWTMLIAGMCLWAGCNKKDYLNARPASDLFVPGTLDNFQELLDKDVVMNETPVLGELCSDNYYLLNTFWLSLTIKEHNAYIWAPDVYQGIGNVGDWNTPYQAVFYANVVLDGIDKIAVTGSNQQ